MLLWKRASPVYRAIRQGSFRSKPSSWRRSTRSTNSTKPFGVFDGLEWIGEYDLDDIEPDEDFFNPKQPQERLPGRLYLIFQNQQGLQQLLSLWRIFDKNPGHPQFGKGRAKFRRLFDQLKDIHPWGHADRLRETGLLETWAERVQEGQETMRVELELWPRRSPGHRTKAEQWISELTRNEQGRVLGSFDATADYAYHAMLVELPIQAVERILHDPNVGLARCEEIMLFRPTGQISAPPSEEPFRVNSPEPSLPPAEGAPVAALLDGLPFGKHRRLDGRLVVDDPERWEDEYPFADRKHGTAMASLILHGELDAEEAPLRRPLYVRPVMRPDPRSHERTEPEILCPGGRSLFRQGYGTEQNAVLEPIQGSRPPGQKVAAPGVQAGDLRAVRYTRGTSNAAALVTRTACQLYDMLLALRADSGDDRPPDESIAILLRARRVCAPRPPPRILQLCRTVPLSFPHLFIAAMAALGEPVEPYPKVQPPADDLA